MLTIIFSYHIIISIYQPIIFLYYWYTSILNSFPRRGSSELWPRLESFIIRFSISFTHIRWWLVFSNFCVFSFFPQHLFSLNLLVYLPENFLSGLFILLWWPIVFLIGWLELWYLIVESVTLIYFVILNILAKTSVCRNALLHTPALIFIDDLFLFLGKSLFLSDSIGSRLRIRNILFNHFVLRLHVIIYFLRRVSLASVYIFNILGFF